MTDGVSEVKEEEFWEKHLERKKQIGEKSDNEDEYLGNSILIKMERHKKCMRT